MDEAVRRVLSEYETRIAAEKRLVQSVDLPQFIRRRDEFLLPIGPETAQVLHILIKSAMA
jgi:hypothetical protein